MLQKIIIIFSFLSLCVTNIAIAEVDEHFYDKYYFQYAKFVDCTAVVFEKGDDEVVICEYTITIGNVTKSILRELTQSDVERIFKYEDTNE